MVQLPHRLLLLGMLCLACTPGGNTYWTTVDGGPADAGECVWFEPCVPENRCHTGHQVCIGTKRQCADEGTAVVNGTSCGEASVCYSGLCGVCGTACIRGYTSCEEGLMSCSEPEACVATGRPLPDLTKCAAGTHICVESTCQACTDLHECIPDDHCHKGYLTCDPDICHDTGQVGPDGRDCGADGVCRQGLCAPTPYRLELVSGNNQTAFINQALHDLLVLKLTDAQGFPLPLTTVRAKAPPGAAATPSQGVTDANGEVAFELRLSRAIGSTSFAFTGPGNSQTQATFTAVPPPALTLFGMVNDSYLGGNDPAGPATTHRIQAPGGIAVASDGTIYFSDMFNCRVEKVSPAGHVTAVVGTSGVWNCGFSAEAGAAASMSLRSPTFLALDDTGTSLFVSDSGNDRVLRVDLAARVVTTYAGGGRRVTPPYGDGEDATIATLSAPSWIGWGPDGGGGHALFISDSNRGAMRYVDSGGIIHTLPLPASTGDCTVDVLAVKSCGFGCSLAWSATGTYLSARFCGTEFGSKFDADATPGIVRLATNGTYVRVAGKLGGSFAESVASTSAGFYETPLMAPDPAGNLFLVIRNENRIRRIDAATGLITTVAGSVTIGSEGRYVPASAGRFALPSAFAFDRELNLHVVDNGNLALRTIWQAAAVSSP